MTSFSGSVAAISARFPEPAGSCPRRPCPGRASRPCASTAAKIAASVMPATRLEVRESARVPSPVTETPRASPVEKSEAESDSQIRVSERRQGRPTASADARRRTPSATRGTEPSKQSRQNFEPQVHGARDRDRLLDRLRLQTHRGEVGRAAAARAAVEQHRADRRRQCRPAPRRPRPLPARGGRRGGSACSAAARAPGSRAPARGTADPAGRARGRRRSPPSRRPRRRVSGPGGVSAGTRTISEHAARAAAEVDQVHVDRHRVARPHPALVRLDVDDARALRAGRSAGCRRRGP